MSRILHSKSGRRHGSEWKVMEEANYEAKRIMADEELRKEAQVRLNVTSNKLYTSLVKEYFKNVWQAGKAATGLPAEANKK